MSKVEGSLRVLMVDDNPLDRELVGELLAGHDVRFRWAGDLQAGLSAVCEGFDVVLLDHNLPDGHGSDRVGAFRDLAPDAALVGLVSEGAVSVEDAFLQAGADKVFLKMDLAASGLADRLRGLTGATTPAGGSV